MAELVNEAAEEMGEIGAAIEAIDGAMMKVRDQSPGSAIASLFDDLTSRLQSTWNSNLKRK